MAIWRGQRVYVGELKAIIAIQRHSHLLWLTPTDKQRSKIEQIAQATLNACILCPGASLADLYDKTIVSMKFCEEHQQNDKATKRTCDFTINAITEIACVTGPMQMHWKSA